MHSYTKNKKFSGEVNWVPLALNKKFVTSIYKHGVRWLTKHPVEKITDYSKKLFK